MDHEIKLPTFALYKDKGHENESVRHENELKTKSELLFKTMRTWGTHRHYFGNRNEAGKEMSSCSERLCVYTYEVIAPVFTVNISNRLIRASVLSPCQSISRKSG